MSVRAGLLGAAALALLACEPTNRPTMNPGQDCISCHHEGGEADGLRWTVAGTVYPALDAPEAAGVQGVRVRVSDVHGKLVQMVTNAAGNFYTAEDLDSDAGLRVELEYLGHCRPMNDTPKPGFTYEDVEGQPPPAPIHGVGCNHCHADPPPAVGRIQVVAPGRLVIPQWYEAQLQDFRPCGDGGDGP